MEQVTKEQVKNWSGPDLDFAIETFVEMLNGKWTPEEIKQNIIEYNEENEE